LLGFFPASVFAAAFQRLNRGKKSAPEEDEKALESQSSRQGKSVTPRRINCVALTAEETVILPLGWTNFSYRSIMSCRRPPASFYTHRRHFTRRSNLDAPSCGLELFPSRRIAHHKLHRLLKIKCLNNQAIYLSLHVSFTLYE
jgi:hypothetical protein